MIYFFNWIASLVEESKPCPKCHCEMKPATEGYICPCCSYMER